MKKIHSIIFDLDGTLTNTLPLSLSGSKETVRHISGKILEDKEVFRHFGKTEDALFKDFLGSKWEDGVRFYARYFEERADKEIVFPGIFDVLEFLKTHEVKTALVTGRGPSSTEVILRKTGLSPYFETVKTGSVVKSIKTECIEETLAAWRMSAAHVFYIGDAPTDVADAKAAGITALSAAWFVNADKKAQAAQKPFKIFDTVAEFYGWIKGMVN
jgi:HAD superfamily hydrolase (TIGR01549 family)